MTENKANAISVSLLNRKIYAVCYTGFDTISAFHGALYGARRRFLETGKAARVRETGIYDGTPGEVRGKIGRRGFKWEKSAGKRTLESAFSNGSQRGIAFWDPDGALRARIFFDRDQHWLRTEYFAPDDDQRAKVSFKPDDTRDAVLRFDYSRSTGKTKETTLFPVPYAFQTAEQSLQNAHCGSDSLLLIATDTGEFAYCPRELLEEARPEAAAPHDAALAEPAEDVPGIDASQDRDAAPGTEPESPPPEKDEAAKAPVPSVSAKAEEMPEKEAEPAESPTGESPNSDPQSDAAEALAALGISAADAERVRETLGRLLEEDGEPAETTDAASLTLIRAGEAVRYTGRLEKGRRAGFGRTETPEGVTLYEGEYKADKRDGFGAHHYRSGAVSYIGDFKDDKRAGFGVSFRESDHALHVSRWADGKPEGYAALFDPSGALRYAGKIEGGKKQGAGVSIDPAADTVFVAKYKDNAPTGEGALFSGDGTLLYAGGWKDGKRCGHGVEFDRAGNVVYAGEWKDDAYLNGILYKKVQGAADGEN